MSKAKKIEAIASPTVTTTDVIHAAVNEVEGAAKNTRLIKEYATRGAGLGSIMAFTDAAKVEAWGKNWDESARSAYTRHPDKSEMREAVRNKLKVYKGRVLDYIAAMLAEQGHAMPEALQKRADKVKAATVRAGAKNATRSPEEITREELKAVYARTAKRLEGISQGNAALEKALSHLAAALKTFGVNPANIG